MKAQALPLLVTGFHRDFTSEACETLWALATLKVPRVLFIGNVRKLCHVNAVLAHVRIVFGSLDADPIVFAIERARGCFRVFKLAYGTRESFRTNAVQAT